MGAFDFVTADWLDLQTWLAQVRELPRTATEFTARYGTFDDDHDTDATVAALTASAAFADKFGSAAAVTHELASDGGYLTSSTPPSMIYGHLIWWAMQVGNAASSARDGLASLTASLGHDQVSAGDVRTEMAGDGGIASVLSVAAHQGGELVASIRNLRSHVLPQVEVLAGTGLINEANQAIGGLGAQIATLRMRAVADYQAWKHQALGPDEPLPPIDIAGNTAAGGFPWPFGKGKEEKARKDYAAVRKQIEALQGDEAMKARFVADVGGLDMAGIKVAPALDQLVSGITRVDHALDQQATRVTSVAASADDTQLVDAAWLTKALDAGALGGLATDATAFVQRALVTTHVQAPPS